MRASQRHLPKLQIEELEARIAPTVLVVGSPAKEEDQLSRQLLSLSETAQDSALDVTAPTCAADGAAVSLTDGAASAFPESLLEPAGGPTEAQLALITGGDGAGEGDEPSGGASYVISGIPAYLWYAGCGPTAGGMILGYWDVNGFANLVVGDAADTSGNITNIRNMIGSPEHFADYNGTPDNSEPGHNPHADNCVADFMNTSQSYYGLADGWTSFSYADDGLELYAHLRGYSDADGWNEAWWSGTLWANTVAAIDAGYPVMFLVDSDGNGGTDHFVTVVGYNDSTMQYACYDTWYTTLRWCNFTTIGGGAWSVYGATFFWPGTADMTLVLDAASDTGISSSDHLTNDAAPTFSIAVPGAGTIFIDYDNDGTFDQQVDVTQPGTYQFQNSSPFLDGTHTIRSRFTPSAGSDVESTIDITVDTVAPGVPNAPDLSAASDSGVLNTDNITNDWAPTLDLSGFGTYYRLYRDSVQVSGDYDTAASFLEGPTLDGSYTYTLRAVDAAGNLSGESSALTVTVDTVAPAVPNVPDLAAGSDSGLSTTDNLTNDATPTLDLSGFESYYRLFRGATQVSGDYATATSFTEVSALTDGAYSYTLRAVDTAGNLSAASSELSVTIDTVAPSVPDTPDLNATSDSGLSNTDNFTNVVTPVLDLSGFGTYYRLYREVAQVSGDYATATSFTEASPLTDGAYSYTLRAVDTAGNPSAPGDGLSVTIDTLAPSVPNVPDLNAASDSGILNTDDITNVTTPTLNLGGFGTYYRLFRDAAQLSSDYAAATSFSEASPLLDGSYDYTLQAVDAAGNVSSVSSALSVTVDTVAPSVASVPDLNASSDSGVSSTDDVTNVTTPVLDLSGFGTYYRLFRDAAQVSTDYATATSFTEASPLTDGAYSYTLYAVDTAGNVSEASSALSVTLNTVAPSVPDVPDLNAASDSGFSTSDNITNVTTPTLGLGGFGTYYQLLCDGVQVSQDYASAASFTEGAPLTDGSYDYTLRAVDAAGNASAATSALSVTVDTLAPSVPNVPDLSGASDSGVLNTDNITNVSMPILNLSGFGTYYRLYRDSVQVSGDYATAANFMEVAPLLDASYSYTLRAVDAAGNASAASTGLSVTVDTVAPSVPSVPDLNVASDSGVSSTDDITNLTTPTLDLSGFDSYYRLFRDATQLTGDYATAVSFTESSPLTDGSYSYSLRAVDAAGNVSSASSALPVTVDTVAPSVPNVPDLNAASDSGVSDSDNVTNVTPPTLDLSGFGSYYRLFRDATQESTNYATATSFTEASPLTDGNHSYTLCAVDAAGNVSADSGTLAVTIDAVAPSIPDSPDLNAASDSGVSGVDDITSVVTPVLDLSGFGTYYRLFRDTAQVTSGYATAASFTEASPLVDGSYDYTLQAVDAAGNVSAASGALSVTIDTVAPSVPNVPDLNAASDSGFSTSDNIIDVTAPTLDLSGFGTYYRLFRDAAQASGDYATAVNFTEAAPLLDGSYTYTLRAVDAAGNVSAASSALSVTIDTVAPSVPNVPDLAAGSDSGLSSGDDITNVTTPTLDLTGFGSYYRLFRGAAQLTGDYATASSFTEASPLTDGSYDYALQAVDTAGNLSAPSAGLSVTIDTVAPGVPNVPDLNAASDSGVFSADNITNVATPVLDLSGFGAYYRLFRDAAQVSTDYATTATYTETAPLLDGSHAYTLQAVDAAGNLSVATSALFVTIDTVAPSVPIMPDLNAASDSGFSSTDDMTNVAASTLDLSGFGTYYRLLRDGVQVSDDYATATSLTEASPLTDGTYGYTLRAVDAAGNVSLSSAALFVTVDTVAPTAIVTPAPGEAFGLPPSELVASFAEGVEAASITASSFRLQASGQDGTFDDGNETAIVPTLVSYDAVSHTATFTISGSLPTDTYRILLDGSSTIRDLAGNALDGDGDGTSGDDYVSTFTVGGPSLVITDSLGAADDQYLDFGFHLFPAGGGVATVTLTNTGPIPLLVSSIGLSDPANYSIAWDGDGSAPTSIAGNSDRVATITFQPAALGAAPATLTVESNDPLQGIGTVDLDGTGYVAETWTSGGTTVVVVDAAGNADLLRENVRVRFGRDGTVSSIRLGGDLPMDGVGILVSGAPSVGSITDARGGAIGALSFIASDAPIANLRLRGSVEGHLLNGRTLEGFDFASDIDGDGSMRDENGVSVAGGLHSLKVSGSIVGDVVVMGSLNSLQTTGALAGDLLISGDAGTARIGGDLGTEGGYISIGGNLSRLSISSRLTAADLLGDLEVDGDVRGIAIGSRALGGNALGNIEVWGALRALTVAGDLDGAVTVHSNLTNLTAQRICGAITVAGNLGSLSTASQIATAVLPVDAVFINNPAPDGSLTVTGTIGRLRQLA